MSDIICKPLTELQRAYLGEVDRPGADLTWASTAIKAWAYRLGYVEHTDLDPRPRLTLTGRAVCHVDREHRVRVWGRTVGTDLSGRPVRAISASCSCHFWMDQTNESGRPGIRRMRNSWRAHFDEFMTGVLREVGAE
jgi:hypothetical protein